MGGALDFHLVLLEQLARVMHRQQSLWPAKLRRRPERRQLAIGARIEINDLLCLLMLLFILRIRIHLLLLSIHLSRVLAPVDCYLLLSLGSWLHVHVLAVVLK